MSEQQTIVLFVLPPHRSNSFRNCPISCNSSTIVQLDFGAWSDAEAPLRLPINATTVEKALRVGAELYRRFREAERNRIAAHLAFHGNATGAILAHARYAAPKPEAVDRANVAGVLREATSVLLRGGGGDDALDESERLPTTLDIETLHRLLPTIDVGRVIGYVRDEHFRPKICSSAFRAFFCSTKIILKRRKTRAPSVCRDRCRAIERRAIER